MKNIAVLCTGIAVRAFQDTMMGIRECAIASNCNVFFIATDKVYRANKGYECGEINIFKSIDYKLFDGIILINSTFDEKDSPRFISELIKESKVPAVCIEGQFDWMYNLRIDNRSAMRDMITHLITEHGYKRICFVTGPLDNNEALQRYEAYKQTMSDFDLYFDEKDVYEGSFSPSDGKKAAELFIQNHDRYPDAIVCSNDLMALGAIQYLNQKGISVPDTIAVTGFDDMLQSRYSEPRLTTVSRENYKAGYAACAKLINGIIPEELGKTVGLTTNVVKRESCGCACRDEVDLGLIRKNYFAMEDKNGSLTMETRTLIAELSVVNNLETLKEKITPFIERLICDEFYICLLNEWEGIHSDNLAAVKYGITELKDDYIKSGIGSGTFMTYGYAAKGYSENSKFGLAELIKTVKERNSGRNYYVVTPIHFGDRMFGYSVILNCENVFNNSYYVMWIQCIGNALELIRRQNVNDAVMKKVDSLWIFDNLTGLYNKAGFAKYGSPAFRDCRLNSREAALFFVDMDDLKHVNEVHGHDCGDNFIKAMAHILKKRKKHGEVIMRYGGDEFVILAMGLDEEAAKQYCASIHSEVEDYNKMHNLPLPLSVTIGYTVRIPGEGESLDDAIEAADREMIVTRREKLY